MFRNTKGQSALEYLMTYGWALIVIVAVIAALYFIIPKTSVTCTGFTQNMTVSTYKMDGGGISVEIANGSGKAITDISLTPTITSGNGAFAADTNITSSVQPGSRFTKALTTTTALGGQVSVNLVLTYNDGTFTQTATGTCSGQI